MKIIGLTGPRGVGKSTLAQIFETDYGATRFGFADSLRIGCAAMFGWSYESMSDPNMKELVDEFLGFSRRKAMQVVGTDVVRNMLNHNTWLILLEQRIIQLPENTLIVIDDVRFDNEARFIRNSGGIIVHIKAENRLTSNNDSHESENGVTVALSDFSFHNDGTKEDLPLIIKNLIGLINDRKGGKLTQLF